MPALRNGADQVQSCKSHEGQTLQAQEGLNVLNASDGSSKSQLAPMLHKLPRSETYGAGQTLRPSASAVNGQHTAGRLMPTMCQQVWLHQTETPSAADVRSAELVMRPAASQFWKSIGQLTGKQESEFDVSMTALQLGLNFRGTDIT